MKKGLLIVSLLFMLVGCEKENMNEVFEDAPSQQLMHCEAYSNDVVNGYETLLNYTIYYTGEYVDRVETVETVISESDELLDYMEEYINSTYTSMDNAYGGYTYEVIKEDDKIISNVKIDYSEMDLNQYATDLPTMANYIENGKFLVDGIVEIYESFGATCE